MGQYIDKSVLVAWMNRFIDDETESNKLFEHRKNACELQRSNARVALLKHMISELDTLEVKEITE